MSENIKNGTEKTIDFTNLKIERKADGTFIVDNNGVPFQITDDYPLGDITTTVINSYIDNGGEVTEYVEPTFELSEEEKTLQQINELKAQLTATDYKIIKAVEQGVEVDQAVSAERQKIRDEINRLEVELDK